MGNASPIVRLASSVRDYAERYFFTLGTLRATGETKIDDGEGCGGKVYTLIIVSGDELIYFRAAHFT